MNKTILRLLSLVLILGGLSGCKTPEVTLKNALLTGLTATKMNIGLNLELFNPNDYEVPLQQVDYKLALFNADFTDGATRFSKRVGPQSRTDVEVPLGIRYSAVQLGVQGILTKKTIPWGFDGGATFKTPAGAIRVGFNKDGNWRNPLR